MSGVWIWKGGEAMSNTRNDNEAKTAYSSNMSNVVDSTGVIPTNRR
ncbi:hypothetical protein M5D96_000681 [Drosophila gunungcola]|uniref:Uncharacterized protein n=1 Tax=Drosophila gunungcola TaxID=103775 RepID=A0A9Q0BTZ3_9MUSC|nr:hypothetical protein M5D96_000681 [Drosophila gunungcola]